MADPVLNVVCICGSLRKASYNRMVMNALPGLAPPNMKIREAPPFADFPVYSADIQDQGIPPAVHTLAQAVREVLGRFSALEAALALTTVVPAESASTLVPIVAAEPTFTPVAVVSPEATAIVGTRRAPSVGCSFATESALTIPADSTSVSWLVCTAVISSSS